MDWLLQNTSKAYWIFFIAAFLAAAIAESLQPLRVIDNAERRWLRHGVLFAAGAVTAGLILRLSPVAVALLVADSPYGIFNRLPFWPACVLTVLALDFVHYITHWTYHHVSWLWPIHSIHHSDVDYEVSTAVRFHPLELIVGGGVMLAAIALLAPPPAAVLVSELLTIVTNILVHANADLPAPADRALRSLFVTPSAHRIHHSEDIGDQNTNYGQSLLIWDRLFSTLRTQAASENFPTGLTELRGRDTLSLRYLLTIARPK